MRAFALALIAAAVVASAEHRAEACSPPLPVVIDDPALAEGLAGVPASGPLVVLATNNLEWATGEDLDAVAFVVVDESGTELEGVTEVTGSRVAWRPASPLAPLTTYRATLNLGWWQSPMTFDFSTADAGATFELTADPDSTQLREETRALSTSCCEVDTEVGDCGWMQCWAREQAVYPVLRLDYSDAERRRYRDISVLAAGATVEPSRFGRSIPVVFKAGASFCAQVTATSIIDGSQVTAEVCADPADLVPLEGPIEPVEPECSGPEIDEDTGEEIDGGGCSTSGGSSGAALLLVILAIADLGRRWQLG